MSNNIVSNVQGDLGNIIARALYDNPRLRNIPPPIIDAIVEATFDELVAKVPNDAVLAGTLHEDGWAACESCGDWVPPGEGTDSEEGVRFCADCP